MERDDLELLLCRVLEMRTHQTDFFKRKMPADLKLSKQKESEVDRLIKQFRSNGYDPERFKSSGPSEQKPLF